MKNLEFALVMKLRDMASKGVERGMRDMRNSVGRADRSVDQLSRRMLDYERSTQRAERQSKTLLTTMRRMASERGPVGLVNTLRNVADYGGRAMRVMGKMRDVAAGVAAGGYVISRPMKAAMDFNMVTARLSNTIYSDRDTAGRIAGKKELATLVNGSANGIVGRDEAAAALNVMGASGKFSMGQLGAALPQVTRAASASGASASDMANVALAGMQNFGISAEQLEQMFDMANASGKAGGFELNDMARWLRQQMSSAANAGMGGFKDLQTLLAANQVVMTGSGSADKAGNNLNALLIKLRSEDLAKNIKDNLGVSASDQFLKARAGGMDSLTATVALVDQYVQSMPKYQELQKKMAAASPGEQQALFEQMGQILVGSALGQFLVDQESGSALAQLVTKKDMMRQQMAAADPGAAAGSIAADQAVVEAEVGYKTQDAWNKMIEAMTAAMEKLLPTVGKVADLITEYAAKYPDLSASIALATAGLATLAAAAGAAGLAGALNNLKNGGGVGGVGGVIETGKKVAQGVSKVPLAAAAGPLAAIGWVSDWAGDTSHDQERIDVLKSISDALASIMPDFTAGSRERYEANRIELNVQLDGRDIGYAISERQSREASRH